MSTSGHSSFEYSFEHNTDKIISNESGPHDDYLTDPRRILAQASVLVFYWLILNRAERSHPALQVPRGYNDNEWLWTIIICFVIWVMLGRIILDLFDMLVTLVSFFPSLGILLIRFYMLAELQMSMRQKIAVVGAFGLGCR